jgi:DNA-3-methyladenine glycosylase I
MKTISSQKKQKTRCKWPRDDERMIHYHDTIWGFPTRDDTEIFQAIVLDTNQAGLSWKIIWHKYDGFRKAYANFNPNKIAKFTTTDAAKLMQNPGIIRNRLKILSTITNAQYFLEIQREFGTFANYIWSFTNHQIIQNNFSSHTQIPSRTEISDAISRDLKKRGFKFVGSTVVYAFMQGIGMVNDHTTDCFLHKPLSKCRLKKNIK